MSMSRNSTGMTTAASTVPCPFCSRKSARINTTSLRTDASRPNRIERANQFADPPALSVQEDVDERNGGNRLNVMRCHGKGVLDEETPLEGAPHHGKRRHHGEKRSHYDGELDGRLPRLVLTDRYKPFMPSAMAFHNSCSFGLNTMMANIAITTSTPTRIAYSVVPCPFVDLRMVAIFVWPVTHHLRDTSANVPDVDSTALITITFPFVSFQAHARSFRLP